jgi:hypothetical protein
VNSPPTNFAWHRAAAKIFKPLDKVNEELADRLLQRIDELEKSGVSVKDFVNRPD